MNIITNIFLYLFYNTKKNDTEYAEFESTTINNKIETYYNDSVNSSYDIGYKHGSGINNIFLTENDKFVIKIQTLSTLSISDTLTFFNFDTSDSFIATIEDILKYDSESNEYILYLNTVNKLTPLYKNYEITTITLLNECQFFDIYNVTLNITPIDALSKFDDKDILIIDQSTTNITFCFTEIFDEDIEFLNTYYFSDIAENLYSFTYNKNDSDREILTLIGFDNYKFLDVFVPYLENSAKSNFIKVYKQLQENYNFLYGYYTALTEKIYHCFYEYKPETIEYNILNNVPKYDYSEIEDKLIAETSITWYNDLLFLYYKINYMKYYYKSITEQLENFIFVVFNNLDNFDISVLENDDNTFNENFDYDNAKTQITDLINDYISNTDANIFLIYYNVINNYMNFRKIELKQYDNNLSFSEDYTEITDYYNCDSDMNFFNGLKNDISLNDTTEINKINELYNVIDDILNIDFTSYRIDELKEFIENNISDNNYDLVNYLISFLHPIDFFENKSYTIDDIVMYENKLYFCIKNNTNIEPTNKMYWKLLYEDNFTNLLYMFTLNTSSYYKNVLKVQYYKILDLLKKSITYDSDNIIIEVDENNINDRNFIKSYLSKNWYEGPIFNLNSILSENENLPNLIYDNSNIFLVFYSLMLNLNLDFNTENTLNENIFLNYIKSHTDFITVIKNNIDDILLENNTDNVNLLVIKNENINQFINKLENLNKDE